MEQNGQQRLLVPAFHPSSSDGTDLTLATHLVAHAFKAFLIFLTGDEINANIVESVLDIVWQTKETIKADAWSPYLPEDKGKIADWTYPWVCGNCTEAKYKD